MSSELSMSVFSTALRSAAPETDAARGLDRKVQVRGGPGEVAQELERLVHALQRQSGHYSIKVFVHDRVVGLEPTAPASAPGRSPERSPAARPDAPSGAQAWSRDEAIGFGDLEVDWTG